METMMEIDREKKIGVLLTNLGTPEAPTTAAVRRYLAEFLSDRRVVDRPRWLWLPVLHGVILRLRPRRSAHAYQKVWTDEGSPLLNFGRRQQLALQLRLPGDVPVVLAMRYGQPSIAAGLQQLRAAGVTRVLLIPLYPQYSGSTTASTFDAVAAAWSRWPRLPELRMVMDYHDQDGYIQALANSVRDYWNQHGRGEKLLLSFHGTPQAMSDAGDPYYLQCQTTARLLAQRLQLSDDQCQLTFQSRFGPEAWLQPYTDKTLEALAQQGVGRVDVLCPGFSADCLETLEEIAMLNRDLFLQAGGRDYHYIPALNDREDHVAMLAGLVRQYTQGWL
jgi:ferrochelatase